MTAHQFAMKANENRFHLLFRCICVQFLETQNCLLAKLFKKNSPKIECFNKCVQPFSQPNYPVNLISEKFIVFLHFSIVAVMFYKRLLLCYNQLFALQFHSWKRNKPDWSKMRERGKNTEKNAYK